MILIFFGRPEPDPLTVIIDIVTTTNHGYGVSAQQIHNRLTRFCNWNVTWDITVDFVFVRKALRVLRERHMIMKRLEDGRKLFYIQKREE